MSAGRFVRTRYETARGNIHPIRVQPETLVLTIAGATNDAPAGSVDGQGSARVSTGRRSLGINARLVRLAWSGSAPAGYDANGTITLPWLQELTFVALLPGATGTYLGAGVVLVGKTGESVR